MPDRDVATIRDLIHYQYATIIAKSAFAASDGESSLKHRGDKKLYDSIPPLLASSVSRPSTPVITAQARPTWRLGRGRGDNGAGHRCCYSVRGDDK